MEKQNESKNDLMWKVLGGSWVGMPVTLLDFLKGFLYKKK